MGYTKLCVHISILLCIVIANIHAVQDVGRQSPATSESNSSGGINQQVSGKQTLEEFCLGQRWCASLTGVERLALEAIKYLHSQLDDDQNGSIDLKESDGFLREELQYEKGAANRQKNFHRNNDKQISVKNLWDLWITSEVHNWTTQQTVDWLKSHADLPEYETLFSEKEINGTYLPLLAANQNHFLSRSVGMKDPRHKQKLSLKAQDAVLFGSPKDTSNLIKDVILTSLLAIALTVIWVVYRRYQMSQKDLEQKREEIEKLGRAADQLKQLQEELDKTRTDESPSLNGNQNYHDQTVELEKLKHEVEYLNDLLKRTESELTDKCWLPPPQLRQLLLATYDLEKRAFSNKQAAAAKQLNQAREACEKLRDKRSSIYRAFVPDNSRDMDRVDRAIVEATTSFSSLTTEKREMTQRWKEIENLVQFPIMSMGSGMHDGTTSRPLGAIGRTGSSGSTRSNRQSSVLHDSRESLQDDTRM